MVCQAMHLGPGETCAWLQDSLTGQMLQAILVGHLPGSPAAGLTGQTPQGMAVKAVVSGTVSRAAWKTSSPPRSRRSSAPSYSSVRRMLCTSPGPSSSRDTLCAAIAQTRGDRRSP